MKLGCKFEPLYRCKYIYVCKYEPIYVCKYDIGFEGLHGGVTRLWVCGDTMYSISFETKCGSEKSNWLFSCWLLRRTCCVTRTLSSLRWKKNLANLSICCKWKDLTVCETPTKCKSGLTLSPPFMLEAGFSKKCKKKTSEEVLAPRRNIKPL